MAKRSKTKGGKKKATKTPVRNIGATVEKYVQIRKEKNGVLYKATEDPDTGGISFLPKTRKTPISFDGRRHKLVEKTPEEISAAKSEQDFLLAADKPANQHQKKRATGVYTSRRVKRAESKPSKGATKETKKLSRKKDVVSTKQKSASKSTGIKSASTPETIVSSDEEKQSPAKPTPTKLRKHVRAKRSQVSSSSGQNDWRVHGAVDW